MIETILDTVRYPGNNKFSVNVNKILKLFIVVLYIALLLLLQTTVVSCSCTKFEALQNSGNAKD